MNKSMRELAQEFQIKHIKNGKVTKVTDYCFWWKTLPDKNDNTKTTVYMKSYFLNFN